MTSGTCQLCPTEPWVDELGVQNFPSKPAKKPPRVERTLTCVVARPGEEGEEEFLLRQRPNKGQYHECFLTLGDQFVAVDLREALNIMNATNRDMIRKMFRWINSINGY